MKYCDYAIMAVMVVETLSMVLGILNLIEGSKDFTETVFGLVCSIGSIVCLTGWKIYRIIKNKKAKKQNENKDLTE